MKVWVTEHALTQGIYPVEGRVSDIGHGRMFAVAGQNFSYHKPDWHETYEEALERAEEMRLKKIESHRRAIAKLEALDFRGQAK